jgi:hypothetical protein
MVNQEAVQVPGAGFIAGTFHATWVDAIESGGRIPWLLLARSGVHLPAEERAEIEQQLQAICDALGMRPGTERVPYVGDRLALRSRLTTLDYGHPRVVFRVAEPGSVWRGAVEQQGAALLAVGLEPLAAGSGQEAIEAYLDRFMPTGRVMLGAVGVRRR